MLVTNQTTQDYWFGPLHLLGGVGQTLTVDDTTDTSLYLSDDAVADAINNLYNSGKVTVSSAASPFPRPTGMPSVMHGDGSPEGLVYAPQGSLYLRRDGGDSWHLYVKSTAVTVNTGWIALPGQELDYVQITANPSGITATTEATSQTVIAGDTVYFDGSHVKLSFFVPQLTSSGSLTATFVIYRDTTVIGHVFGGTVNTTLQAMDFEIFDTPAVGAHAYKVAAYVSTGTLTVNAGAGGSGNLVPGWLRVTKA
ncbi:MAG TPA: hypothetical protein VFW41_10345 [Gaiellaceae bacterium]|nr:hypothetical protein [Gaiellaceae bacterium]